MSNYYDLSIKTKDDIKRWVLAKLGWPHVTVELSEEQVDICINDALEEFTRLVIQDEEYLSLNLEEYDSVSGFTLPNRVTGIFAIEESATTAGSTGGINTLFSVQNVMWNAGAFPDFARGGAGGWITYELAMSYLKLIKQMTGAGFKINYHEREHKLTLIPDPKKINTKGYICIGVNTIRPDDQNYGEVWVKRMTLALAKEIVGQVRSKFNNVSLLGGGSINTKILEEGIAERDKLRDELYEQYQFTKFFVMPA